MGFIETINLLSSSVVLAISGGLRLYVAFLLAGKEPTFSTSLAMALIVYSTYTLDRTMKSKEDEINRPEEKNANKIFALSIVGASIFVTYFILINNRISPLIAFFPAVSGYLYSKGFTIGNSSFKLKHGSGIKNYVVALIWAITICSLVYPAPDFTLALIFIFFFIKSFINTIIFDCRDILGDSTAGLITIPVYFGETKTRKILQVVHSIFHIPLILSVILKIIDFDLTVLLYSWIGGIIYIYIYATSNKTIYRSLIVHGEWAPMIIFRNLVIRFS